MQTLDYISIRSPRTRLRRFWEFRSSRLAPVFLASAFTVGALTTAWTIFWLNYHEQYRLTILIELPAAIIGLPALLLALYLSARRVGLWSTRTVLLAILLGLLFAGMMMHWINPHRAVANAFAFGVACHSPFYNEIDLAWPELKTADYYNVGRWDDDSADPADEQSRQAYPAGQVSTPALMDFMALQPRKQYCYQIQGVLPDGSYVPVAFVSYETTGTVGPWEDGTVCGFWTSVGHTYRGWITAHPVLFLLWPLLLGELLIRAVARNCMPGK